MNWRPTRGRVGRHQTLQQRVDAHRADLEQLVGDFGRLVRSCFQASRQFVGPGAYFQIAATDVG
jgi:hypothetical protein